MVLAGCSVRSGGARATRRILLPLAALPLLLAAGCGMGRFVQRGINFYHGGAFPLAMQEFRGVEPYELELNPKGLCRYLVYRGLTHQRLGEAQLAASYLGRARPVCSGGDPRWLDPAIAAEAFGGAAPGGPAPGPTPPPGGPAEPAPGPGPEEGPAPAPPTY